MYSPRANEASERAKEAPKGPTQAFGRAFASEEPKAPSAAKGRCAHLLTGWFTADGVELIGFRHGQIHSFCSHRVVSRTVRGN
jgi:hypothetical protein